MKGKPGVAAVPTVEVKCRRCGRTTTIVWTERMGTPIPLCTTCASEESAKRRERS